MTGRLNASKGVVDAHDAAQVAEVLHAARQRQRVQRDNDNCSRVYTYEA